MFANYYKKKRNIDRGMIGADRLIRNNEKLIPCIIKE